jgi:hypothetical protein
LRAIYNKSSSEKKQLHLHPAGQVVCGSQMDGDQEEWPTFHFSRQGITVDAITQGCEQQNSNPLNIKLHADLSAVNISMYLREIVQKHWWWTHPHPPVAVPVKDSELPFAIY